MRVERKRDMIQGAHGYAPVRGGAVDMCVYVSEPLPMKLRALPQSFWQQPNHTNSLSPGAVYPVLPPLSTFGAAKDEVESLAAGNIRRLSVNLDCAGDFVKSALTQFKGSHIWIGFLMLRTREVACG